MPELRFAPGVENLSQEAFFSRLSATPLVGCLPEFRRVASDALGPAGHGDLPRWLDLLARLPRVESTSVGLREPAVRAGNPGDCDAPTRAQIRQLLQELHPWRKGPFSIHGILIDAEWRSDRKWRRLEDCMSPLAGRMILDVGCGNGYYGWRMLGAGADLVLGIDPGNLYNLQFQALRHFIGDLAFGVLPLALEDLPHKLRCFDTVFSMGVFYHRRSPLDHLLELRGCLRPGGELVLETLVIEGGKDQALVPENRYAQMRNVWFIPSCDTLAGWLKRCGFRAIELADVTVTSPEEQRRTEWMRFHSLTDFLLPGDSRLTVEGLPAPRRAILIARSP